MPLNNCFEAPKWVSTKTPVLKHYYRHQGVCVLVCWVLALCEGANLGVFDLCHFPPAQIGLC